MTRGKNRIQIERRLKASKELSIINNICAKHGLSVRVVELVARYPFRYLKRSLVGNEQRPIRLRYLGAFVQKNKINKSKYADKIIESIENRYMDYIEDVLKNNFGVNVSSKEMALEYVKMLKNSGDIVGVTNIFKLCRDEKNRTI